MKKDPLREIDGKKIRRQYFNIFIFVEIIMSLFLVTPILVINTLWGDSGTKLNSWSEMFTDIIAVAIVLMLPFMLISFFNRFLFGKIVCVLNDKGVYYLKGASKRVAKWDDIHCIEYGIRMWPFFVTFDHPWCYAHIIGEDLDVNISHTPFMLLKKTKKHNKKIKLEFEKTGLIMVALAVAIPFAVSCILGLLFVIS